MSFHHSRSKPNGKMIVKSMNILYPNYTVYTIIPKLYSATDRKMDKTAQVVGL